MPAHSGMAAPEGFCSVLTDMMDRIRWANTRRCGLRALRSPRDAASTPLGAMLVPPAPLPRGITWASVPEVPTSVCCRPLEDFLKEAEGACPVVASTPTTRDTTASFAFAPRAVSSEKRCGSELSPVVGPSGTSSTDREAPVLQALAVGVAAVATPEPILRPGSPPEACLAGQSPGCCDDNREDIATLVTGYVMPGGITSEGDWVFVDG